MVSNPNYKCTVICYSLLACKVEIQTRKFVKCSKFFSFGVMNFTPLGLMDLFLTISIQNSEELGPEDRSSRSGKIAL